MENLIDDLLRQAYGEAEARRIAGSYRLAVLAVQLQRRLDARASLAPAAPPDHGDEQGVPPMSNELIQTSRDPYAATITATTTAAPVGSSLESLIEVMIQAHPDNGVDVLLGTDEVQCWVLEPGDQVNWPIRNPALIYARTASGTAVVNLIGRGGE